MKNQLLAKGRVTGLCVNGEPTERLLFDWDGPAHDKHSGYTRAISGHDRAYKETSDLKKGDLVFNWRSWTGIASEEILEVEKEIGYNIPPGCLLENITFSGIPAFSELPPTSRLVFPERYEWSQAILAVWEQNAPCHGVGKRLEEHHQLPGLSPRFIKAALRKRGLMGFVLRYGIVDIGDEVLVYPPVS